MSLITCGINIHQCAIYLKCSITTIRKWGCNIESTEQLLDIKRAGRPLLFSESMRLKIIGLYCQNPLQGCTGWSYSWAEKYFRKHIELIGKRISRSSIHRIVRMHNLRPHLIRYFLQITDPCFFQKMEHIIKIYLNLPKYLFCFDECTGIQALERLTAKMLTSSGMKIEFEYKRNGTRDLYSFLNVRTGEVFGKCTENHRQETLIEIFTEHVKQWPADAELHYICDNLANHSCEMFCRKVAELSDVEYPDLKTAKERRKWLQFDLNKRIIIHFTPFHGSWLNLVEIWFGIIKSKCIKGCDFSSVQELADIIHIFIDTWNEYFAHPFKWSYTGKGLAEKAVLRLTNWLVLESKEMKLPFFKKQLQLMINLIKDYWEQVSLKQWELLYKAITNKTTYIAKILDDDKKANQFLQDLLQALEEKLGPNQKIAA